MLSNFDIIIVSSPNIVSKLDNSSVQPTQGTLLLAVAPLPGHVSPPVVRGGAAPGHTAVVRRGAGAVLEPLVREGEHAALGISWIVDRDTPPIFSLATWPVSRVRHSAPGSAAGRRHTRMAASSSTAVAAAVTAAAARVRLVARGQQGS